MERPFFCMCGVSGFISAKIFLTEMIFIELTCLAPKITGLKFRKCSFFYLDVYCTLYGTFQGFPYFREGSVYRKQAASVAEPMAMQIAQDKRNVDRFLTYIVREDS